MSNFKFGSPNRNYRKNVTLAYHAKKQELKIKKSNKTIEFATINSLSHDGRGITHINDKTTFIENALPNEEVNFTYTKRHNKFNSGKAIEILKHSPERIPPLCKHYGVCGGCTMQHLNHQKQIEFKQKTLLEHLKHIGGIETENILPSLLGPTIEYRSKARLSVRYVTKKQKVLIGFREKNGSFVVDSKECPILNASVGKKIHLLSSLIEKLSIYKQIPQIEVACGDEITALVFRNLQDFSDSDIKLITEFADENKLQIYLQSGGLDTVKKIAPDDSTGQLSYKLPKYNLEIIFSPTDFTQINQAINIQLVDLVIELLDPKSDEKVLDLFCGIGNFTLPIATKCKMAIGVEGSKNAILQAIENAEHNLLEKRSAPCFYTFDLTKELPVTSWGKEQYDKILLDPPRTGAKEICTQIKKFNAKKIVYVSCNPTTFARDAKILTENGYKLQNITLADMYPHTSHMEVIASFC